jgi:hypothetical protein
MDAKTGYHTPMLVYKRLLSGNLLAAVIGCQVGVCSALAEGEAAKAPLQGNIVKEHKAKKDHKDAGTQKLTGATHITLESGPRFFARPDDVIVETPVGNVKIDGNSVVLVVSSPQYVAIYDLHDGHKGAVVLDNKVKPFALRPAGTVIIANKALKSFSDVNPVPYVPYRALVNSSLDDQHQVFQADFDVMSMVKCFKDIAKLVDSPDPKVHDLMTDMLKTTAISMSTRQSSEPYQFYMTAEVRALMAKSLAAKEQQGKSN